jgi:hypothetical protein
MGYLYDIGVPTRLRLPLDEIHAALADADNGRVNALTKPRRLPRGKGHHGKPIFDTMRLANASAAVALMHRAGAKIEIACRRAARHLTTDIVKDQMSDTLPRGCLGRGRRDTERRIEIGGVLRVDREIGKVERSLLVPRALEHDPSLDRKKSLQ